MKRTLKTKTRKLNNFKKEEINKAQTIKGGDPTTPRGTEVIVTSD